MTNSEEQANNKNNQQAQQEEANKQQRAEAIKRAQAQAQQQAQAKQQQQAANPNIGNVSQQTQVQPANTATGAQATIEQNLEGDQQAQLTNEKLSLLKRLVGQASPVFEDKTETVQQRDADGNVVDVPVTNKVITGYTYYAVNGQPFEEWIQQAFGGDITLDTNENKLKYNKPIEEIVYTEPQKPNQEQELPKGVRTQDNSEGNQNQNQQPQVTLKK